MVLVLTDFGVGCFTAARFAARFAAHLLLIEAASRFRPSSVMPDRFVGAAGGLSTPAVFTGGRPRLFSSGEPLICRSAAKAFSIAVFRCSRSYRICCRSLKA
jgi:hypothetical protein